MSVSLPVTLMLLSSVCVTASHSDVTVKCLSVAVQLDLPLIGWLLLFLSKNLDVSISAAAAEDVDRGKDNGEF